jgi:hypothetical protein
MQSVSNRPGHSQGKLVSSGFVAILLFKTIWLPLSFAVDVSSSENKRWLAPLIVVRDNPAVRQREVRVKTWVHLSEEDLDSYCLNQFEGAKLEEIEKHLLLCEKCQASVVATDTYIAILREHLVTVACESTRLH